MPVLELVMILMSSLGKKQFFLFDEEGRWFVEK
ncbi:hypothetical protein P22_3324 [Propionispora sp. 2/2-37]|nr:hypothetical protein P22_3324 [Propionispora sp. 2/2-37]